MTGDVRTRGSPLPEVQGEISCGTCLYHSTGLEQCKTRVVCQYHTPNPPELYETPVSRERPGTKVRPS